MTHLITLQLEQVEKIKEMYVDMLWLDNTDNQIAHQELILKKLMHDLDYAMLINPTFLNICKIIGDLVYTKSYFYTCIENQYYVNCYPSNVLNTHQAQPKPLISCLNSLFDFSDVSYALMYAESLKYESGNVDYKEAEDDLYLIYVLSYIFNLDNIQNTYFTIKEEV